LAKKIFGQEKLSLRSSLAKIIRQDHLSPEKEGWR
jgi:hypothetical protein